MLPGAGGDVPRCRTARSPVSEKMSEKVPLRHLLRRVWLEVAQSKDWELITMFQSKLQEYPLYAVPILKNLAASASIPSSQEEPYLYDCRKAHG